MNYKNKQNKTKQITTSYRVTCFILTNSIHMLTIEAGFSSGEGKKNIWPITAQCVLMTYNECDSVINMRDGCVDFTQHVN